jgi:hypothetical protein
MCCSGQVAMDDWLVYKLRLVLLGADPSSAPTANTISSHRIRRQQCIISSSPRPPPDCPGAPTNKNLSFHPINFSPRTTQARRRPARGRAPRCRIRPMLIGRHPKSSCQTCQWRCSGTVSKPRPMPYRVGRLQRQAWRSHWLTIMS